jgi:DNA polymerase I
VHDELVFEVREGEADAAAANLARAMAEAVLLSVPLRVDVGYGANWADAKG